METLPNHKYLQVADYLREQIRSGSWKAGDRLPSHTETRAQFSCTQHTVERAHAMLEKDGLIERRHRLGTFVAGTLRAFNDATSADSWTSDTIAVASLYGHDGMLPGESGWESSIVQGSLKAVQEQDKHALLLHPRQLLPQRITGLLSHPPVGIILSLSSFNQVELDGVLSGLSRTSIPVVVYGNVPSFAAYDCVLSDHVAGARKLTRYLISEGCRRIINVQFDDTQAFTYWQPDRQAGYEQAMSEAGLPANPACRVPKRLDADGSSQGDDFFAGVRHLMPVLQRYLTGTHRCDGILVESDGLVPQVVAVCRILGLEPGRDVLVGGYDNYWDGQTGAMYDSSRPAASIDKRNLQIGIAAVQLLMERLAGNLPAAPQRRIVEPELVVVPASTSLPRPYSLTREPGGFVTSSI